MAFCGKCGAENDNNAKFCQKCGAPLSTQEAPKAAVNNTVADNNNAGAVAAPKSAGKVAPKLIGAICAGVVVFIAIIFAVLNSKPTINLDKYIKFEVTGYDGYGRAYVSVDWDAIEEKYAQKLEYTSAAKKEYKELLSLMTPLDAVEECVSIKLDTNNKLSNGDEIAYTWNIDEQLTDYVKCKVKFKDGSFKVSGLTELAKFDAFADLTVSFDGIAPNGNVNFTYSGKELNSYDFSADKYNELSNGDIIKITIDDSMIERCAEQYGKIPETSEKEYTVEGLKSYLSKASDIDDNALTQMKKQAEDVFNAHAAKNFGEGEDLRSLTYIGNYLLTNKGNSYGNYNYLYLVYKAEIQNTYSNDNKSYNKVNDVYWYICYSSLMVDGDGKVEVDVTKYNTPGDRFTIDSNISAGWFSTKSWYYYGYESLGELYKKVVTSNLDGYNHEDNVDESLAPVAEVKEEDETKADEDTDYILPNSDKELISEEDLEGFDAEKCKLARNEIYARHGRKFKDEALQEYFDSKDWYEGTIDPDDFQESILSETEIKNKDVIVEYEKDKGFK